MLKMHIFWKRRRLGDLTPDPALLFPPNTTTLSSSFQALKAFYYPQERTK